MHLLGRLDLDAEMVDRATLTRVLEEDQFERRLGDCEVRVTRPELARGSAEEFGVERDRFIDAVDVECELDARHGDYLRRVRHMSNYFNRFSFDTFLTYVNIH